MLRTNDIQLCECSRLDSNQQQLPPQDSASARLGYESIAPSDALCRVRVSNSPCHFRDESFTGSLVHLNRHGMCLSCARRDGRQRSPSVHCAPRGMDAVAARMPRRAHVSHHPLRGAVSRPRYRHRSAAVPRLMALMPFHCVVLKFPLSLRRAAVHSTEAYAALTLADGCPFWAKAFASC